MQSTLRHARTVDHLTGHIAALERKMQAIDRIMARRERFLEALDWSAMTVQELEQANWHGQTLHRDLWFLDTAQSDAWLEYWGCQS